MRFPTSRTHSDVCHDDDSQELPLAKGILATLFQVIDDTGATVAADEYSWPPITAACMSCHDSDAAIAHAQLNTTSDATESCDVCHAEGTEFDAAKEHAHAE